MADGDMHKADTEIYNVIHDHLWLPVLGENSGIWDKNIRIQA